MEPPTIEAWVETVLVKEMVAVAGASGYLGRHIVAALAEHGYAVRALVRSRAAAQRPGAFGAPSLTGLVDQWRILDYAAPDSVTNSCAEVDRVVSALGVTRQKTSPWDIDFLGNLRLLEDAERHQAASFLYVNVIHSETGTSLTTRSKHAFAQVLRRSRLSTQIVNPSGYFSDITDFLLMAKKGVGLTIGDGSAKLNPIHGADLAEFIVEKLAGPAGEWDVGGPDILSYRELEELAFTIAQRRGRILRLGPRTVRTLIGIADRSSPQAGNLARFFLEGLRQDAVGTPVGTHHLESYLRSL